MEGKQRIFGMLIIIGLLFLSTYSSVTCVEASPLTEVTLALQEDIPTVDVSPGSSGVVEIDGEITCEKYGPDVVRAFISSEIELGSASLEPVSFLFDGVSGSEETLPFKLTARIPQGTSSSLTPSLNVYGHFDQGGLRSTIPPASQIIIILQYYKIGYYIEEKSVQVNSGENAKIEFKVINYGNGEDFFEIDFKNRDDLLSKGFKLKEPVEVNMEEDTNKSISLHISAPEDSSGMYVAEISILSQGSLSSNFSEEVILPFHIEVTSNIGGQIGSFITSPLGIIIIAIVIVVAVYLKTKKKEKVPSDSD